MNADATACPALTIGDHMVSNYTRTVPIGSAVKFSCDSGYELQGQGQMICGQGGVWSSPTPSCVKQKGYNLQLMPYTRTNNIVFVLWDPNPPEINRCLCFA